MSGDENMARRVAGYVAEDMTARIAPSRFGQPDAVLDAIPADAQMEA